jgi:hypothetical protein
MISGEPRERFEQVMAGHGKGKGGGGGEMVGGRGVQRRRKV